MLQRQQPAAVCGGEVCGAGVQGLHHAAPHPVHGGRGLCLREPLRWGQTAYPSADWRPQEIRPLQDGRHTNIDVALGAGDYKEMSSIWADQKRPGIWAQMRGGGGSRRVAANEYSCKPMINLWLGGSGLDECGSKLKLLLVYFHTWC